MATLPGFGPSMPPERDAAAPGQAGSAVTTAVVVVIAIAALYFGRDIIIPFALAVLLSFALGPIATRLRRWGLGRVPSVLIVVLVAFAAIAGFAALVGSQLIQLADNLPTYQHNILAKIRSLQSAAPSGGIIDRASTMLEELGSELSSGAGAAAGAPVDGEAGREAMAVRIEETAPTPFEVIENIAGPILAPIGTAGLVVVFVVFMLLEREDLRNRLIRLVGGGDLHLTTEALDEAARRVSRYLLMQLIVNVTYGVPIGVGLYLIGVPNALLWGVLATVLRFVPYIGPFIAALFPMALSIAVDPGWSLLFLTVALFLTAELISNNVVEPWLYGSSTGMSAIAVILAAIFWTTLWGPVGLLLATPLTVCLAVMGRYVQPLRFFDVMLGSDPVLAPEEGFYQRMLAGDPEEGEEIAETFLKTRPLSAFYDEVALPALRLAERDRQRGVLVGERRAVVTESFQRVVRELADREDPEEARLAAVSHQGAPPVEAPPTPAVPSTGRPVLCIAGRTGLDWVAAAMLAQLLERRGIGARPLPAEAVSPEGAASLESEGVALVCVSYLSASAVLHARQACRRLRRQFPEAGIMVGLWNVAAQDHRRDAGTDEVPADVLVTSLVQAVDRIVEYAATPIEAPMVPSPIPIQEEERLAELRSLNLLDTDPEEAFDRVTRRLAKAFHAPIALLTLVDDYRQFWKSATGLPEDLAVARQAPRETSMCGHVVGLNDLLVIEDTLKDKRFANNPFLRERGIRFYAGAPLRTSCGRAIGSLCVIDIEPRTITDRERALLQMIADEVMAEIEKRRTVFDASGEGGPGGTEPSAGGGSPEAAPEAARTCAGGGEAIPPAWIGRPAHQVDSM
ncbi:AI-2E family transporter [Virgifigura deserti]|uniref:AI-2E family transporter n=1 Tax=Virgifigura deserti TaxID=2268457 RepID=UPI003CCC423A